jgi:hypothetical protein
MKSKCFNSYANEHERDTGDHEQAPERRDCAEDNECADGDEGPPRTCYPLEHLITPAAQRNILPGLNVANVLKHSRIFRVRRFVKECSVSYGAARALRPQSKKQRAVLSHCGVANEAWAERHGLFDWRRTSGKNEGERCDGSMDSH